VSEWPIEHAWKACLPQGNEGSNPSLSAKLRQGRAYRAMASFGMPTAKPLVLMWFVYIIKSKVSAFIYIGSTHDLLKRLGEHNDGLSQSTKHYRPFEIEAYVAVKTEKKARELENYFKTGSGKAILKKRILTDEALA
jgi:putative endonuclease